MGIVERRERERLETRRRIMEAARDLFARDGYDRVTMRGIAEAIEYSPTAIYYHFKDKDELMDVLCREDFGKLRDAFATAKLPSDPVDRVRAIGRAYVRFGLSHPNHYRFLFMTPPFGGKTERRAESLDMPHPGEDAYEFLHHAVVAAIEGGRFRKLDSHAIAQVLWSAVHGVTSLLVNLPPAFWPMEEPRADLVDQAVDNAARGFLAPGSPELKPLPGRAPGIRPATGGGR